MGMFAAIAGSIAFTVLVIVLVFTLIRRSITREANALADVELDSGPVKLTTRYQRFKTSRMYRGGGIRMTPAHLVLTKTHLHILERPQLYGIIARADLARFTVGTLDNRLHLRSEDPPNASGTIDYRVPVADPDRWVAALSAIGARRTG